MTETREIVVRLQLEYPPGQVSEPADAVVADQPLLYKVGDAARLLAVGVSAVNELIARGEIESVKIGAARRVTRAGVMEFVRRRLAEGDGDAA
jgi:excisionase family DNA binding protein